MNENSPIIIVEDDLDDHEIFREAFTALGVRHELIFFTDAAEALKFLMVTKAQPFLLLSDMNLPGVDGLTFRQLIDENEYLKKKSIPFIFFTTGTSKTQVLAAYDMTVQGFFIKPSSFADLQDKLKAIIDYWSYSVHPNTWL